MNKKSGILRYTFSKFKFRTKTVKKLAKFSALDFVTLAVAIVSLQ